MGLRRTKPPPVARRDTEIYSDVEGDSESEDDNKQVIGRKRWSLFFLHCRGLRKTWVSTVLFVYRFNFIFKPSNNIGLTKAHDPDFETEEFRRKYPWMQLSVKEKVSFIILSLLLLQPCLLLHDLVWSLGGFHWLKNFTPSITTLSYQPMIVFTLPKADLEYSSISSFNSGLRRRCAYTLLVF